MPYLKRKRYNRYRRSRRTKYGRRKGTRTFQNRVKNVLLRTAETKFIQAGKEDQQLWHDIGYNSGVPLPTSNQHAIVFNPWSLITQGTTLRTRIGDKITPRMLVARLWLANKATRPNIQYRVIVARLPKIYAGVAMDGNNLDLFKVDDSGSNGNTLCAMIDNDKGVRAYYDKVFSNEIGYSWAASGNAPRENHKFVRLKIKRKSSRPIQYDAENNTINNPVAIYVIPYDSYGTLQTDNIASCAITYRLYFKDI